MKWFRIQNENRVQPAQGSYPDWKPVIASDCQHQCVYCCIHESAHGGIDNFHVEHFRPKSIFDELVNTITNLYYTCPICNRFKGNDWPGEPCKEFSSACYVDPGEFDYTQIMQHGDGHVIAGTTVSSRYMVARLYLNRPQLIRTRRRASLAQEMKELNEYFRGALEELGAMGTLVANELIRELAEALLAYDAARHDVETAPPYKRSEVRRK